MTDSDVAMYDDDDDGYEINPGDIETQYGIVTVEGYNDGTIGVQTKVTREPPIIAPDRGRVVLTADEARIIAKTILRRVAEAEELEKLKRRRRNRRDVELTNLRTRERDREHNRRIDEERAWLAAGPEEEVAPRPAGEEDRPAAEPEEKIGKTPKAILAWTKNLVAKMVDEDSVEKALNEYRAAKEQRAKVLNFEQFNFTTQMVREARDKVLRQPPPGFGDTPRSAFDRPPAEPEEEGAPRPAGEEEFGRAPPHGRYCDLMDAAARLNAIEQEPAFSYTPTPAGLSEDDLRDWEQQVGYADMMDARRQRDEQEEREKEAIADLKRAAAALLKDPRPAGDEDRPAAELGDETEDGAVMTEEEKPGRPDDRAGAPIIDAHKLAKLTKDYNARQAPDFTLAKYRTQAN